MSSDIICVMCVRRTINLEKLIDTHIFLIRSFYPRRKNTIGEGLTTSALVGSPCKQLILATFFIPLIYQSGKNSPGSVSQPAS